MKKISIELTCETYAWLADLADKEHRSVSGQVRFFLDQLCQTKTDESSQIKETKDNDNNS